MLPSCVTCLPSRYGTNWRRGFLARDTFGIKPLLRRRRQDSVASQVKALLSGGGIDTSLDPAGTVGYFLWGYVPEPHTLYKGIRSLPAGSWLWLDACGRKGSGIFCSIEKELAAGTAVFPAMSREAMRERLREALMESVRYHLIADVPIGISLSSGLGLRPDGAL
jgi:asparagine synthase (glutamine-hydrolysing)